MFYSWEAENNINTTKVMNYWMIIIINKCVTFPWWLLEDETTASSRLGTGFSWGLTHRLDPSAFLKKHDRNGGDMGATTQFSCWWGKRALWIDGYYIWCLSLPCDFCGNAQLFDPLNQNFYLIINLFLKKACEHCEKRYKKVTEWTKKKKNKKFSHGEDLDFYW